jgi:arylsulfatase A-like enzyme
MLLTGRHPFRVGTGPEVGGELAKEETTIAEAFKAHGYRTGGIGKGLAKAMAELKQLRKTN